MVAILHTFQLFPQLYLPLLLQLNQILNILHNFLILFNFHPFLLSMQLLSPHFFFQIELNHLILLFQFMFLSRYGHTRRGQVLREEALIKSGMEIRLIHISKIIIKD